MNERERSSHTHLYGISREFTPTSRSTFQNICTVRAEYVRSTCKKCSRLWDLFPWWWVIIEEHYPGGRLFPLGDSSLPMYVSSYLCTYHLAESIRTSSNHSVFILIHQFSIQMKIRANHSRNIRFEFESIPARTKQFSFSFTCTWTYWTIYDLNENQSSIKIPDNFRFEWKSEHWLLRSYNLYNAYRCRKESVGQSGISNQAVRSYNKYYADSCH